MMAEDKAGPSNSHYGTVKRSSSRLAQKDDQQTERRAKMKELGTHKHHVFEEIGGDENVSRNIHPRNEKLRINDFVRGKNRYAADAIARTSYADCPDYNDYDDFVDNRPESQLSTHRGDTPEPSQPEILMADEDEQDDSGVKLDDTEIFDAQMSAGDVQSQESQKSEDVYFTGSHTKARRNVEESDDDDRNSQMGSQENAVEFTSLESDVYDMEPSKLRRERPKITSDDEDDGTVDLNHNNEENEQDMPSTQESDNSSIVVIQKKSEKKRVIEEDEPGSDAGSDSDEGRASGGENGEDGIASLSPRKSARIESNEIKRNARQDMFKKDNLDIRKKRIFEKCDEKLACKFVEEEEEQMSICEQLGTLKNEIKSEQGNAEHNFLYLYPGPVPLIAQLNDTVCVLDKDGRAHLSSLDRRNFVAGVKMERTVVKEEKHDAGENSDESEGIFDEMHIDFDQPSTSTAHL